MTDLGVGNANGTLNAWFRNSAFATLTGQIQVSLHSGDPGTTGASEIGGSQYARQNTTFLVPSGNAVGANAATNFTGMPACTGSSAISGVGIWISGGAPTFIQGGTLTGGAQQVQGGNTFTLSSLSSSLT